MGLVGYHEDKQNIDHGNHKGEEKYKRTESKFEAIMSKNFPNMEKQTPIFMRHKGPQIGWTRKELHQKTL